MRYLFISLISLALLGCSTSREYYNPLNFSHNKVKIDIQKTSKNIDRYKSITPIWFITGQNNSDELLYGFV
ncbi:hypothetical protein fh0823_05830 [Francisella halioticida]|nr:hypothetical protein fh0823_05830 [Francisella halioticida]